MHLLFAILATFLSAGFFVGNKVLMARYNMPWIEVWRWGLWATSACGFIAYMIMGMPALPWTWVIFAGLCGSLAHVAANKALSWGDASLLIPISGAKPLVLVGVIPLIMGQSLSDKIIYASLLATLGLALTGIVPPRPHKNAPHPYLAFLGMWIAVFFMVGSDVCAASAVKNVDAQNTAAIAAVMAGWCMCMGIAPALSVVAQRHKRPWQARFGAMGLGVVFACFLICMTTAFAVAPNPAIGVAEVNIVIAFRGMMSVLMVLALDRWMAMALEPLPKWVHGLRLIGTTVLGGAVALAFIK